MKNHLGTFINSRERHGCGDASATGLHSIDAICNINKHPAVLGGNPVRQQLCIIDGLLANGNSAGGSFDTRVDRLIMGTFAPIVDYLTAMRIMKDVMNKPDANNNLPKFLTNFDYAETDALDWNEYVPAAAQSLLHRWHRRQRRRRRQRRILPPEAPATPGVAAAAAPEAGAAVTQQRWRWARRQHQRRWRHDRKQHRRRRYGQRRCDRWGRHHRKRWHTSRQQCHRRSRWHADQHHLGIGGSTMTGGASAGAATTAHAAGGSGAGSEATQTTSAQHAAAGKSAGGCSVAGVERRATPWGAMLAFGATVAGKLWRRVSATIARRDPAVGHRPSGRAGWRA